VSGRGEELLRLHTDPELLVLVNAWDVASARVVAGVEGCRAVATASHALAAAFGYDDGEQIPRDLVLDMCSRIVGAVDLPVTADLEAGYGDAAETIRRAIGVGVVGANLEDGMRPLEESSAAVSAAVSAAEAEGVTFVLNARTDAFLLAGKRDRGEVVADAVERGRAFLDAGAACVFVPGAADLGEIQSLVEGIGERRVSLMGLPKVLPSLADLEAMGVARVSYGPFPQRVALMALEDLAGELLGGGALPEVVRAVS
jgi:2-methylisocitrate lyase-like PEP mutase family enzyme